MLKYNKNKVGWLLMNKGELHVVHDSDIEDLLKSIGCLEKYKEGRLKCMYCNDTITFENFQCIIPSGKEILFCCSKYECYKKTLEMAGTG
ncbi:MAG: hypothetical protein PHO15_05445 [Eubacteriales bacterium]|nr:hypothetical protein [Eubacteriales bacterium]